MERKKSLSQKAITLLNIGGAPGLPSNKQKLDYFQKLAEMQRHLKETVSPQASKTGLQPVKKQRNVSIKGGHLVSYRSTRKKQTNTRKKQGLKCLLCVRYFFKCWGNSQPTEPTKNSALIRAHILVSAMPMEEAGVLSNSVQIFLPSGQAIPVLRCIHGASSY